MERSHDEAADLVLLDGTVYMVDAARRSARALAIQGGRISLVGSTAQVAEHVGPRTEVVDLRGRMVLPGFQDAHVHTPGGGIELLRCDLSEGRFHDDYAALIRSFAEDHPDAPWIIGRGWSMEQYPNGTPSRDQLDAIEADRPVFLLNRDGHGAWVNSRALELAGVTADTPDPADGRIERDENGEPQGTLHEGAKELVRRLAPPITSEDIAEGLERGQAFLHELGITAWQDAGVGKGLHGYDSFASYLAAAERGTLTARVVGALWWERDGDEDQIEELIRRRDQATVGRFRAATVKIMQDGVAEDFTAGMLDPYLDGDGLPTGNQGLSFIDPARLRRFVVRLDAEGFQVHVHTIGDRAVREALDAIEAALSSNGPSDRRHHLAHIQVVHPDDIPRFRSLGVVANAQSLWACSEPQMVELTIPFLGEERSGWQYPFGSLVRSGATLAMGSDWPVSSPNPLWGIHTAVNRTSPRGQAIDERSRLEPLLPTEAIDLPTAIAAYTMGSAYVNHLDAQTGSIEVGKWADLVVLDRDLFAIPADEIGETAVVATMVQGELVFGGRDL